MALITVVLMDNENIAQHASGKLDFEKVSDVTLLKRNERVYAFRELRSGVAVYVECASLPYTVTEF